MSKKTFRNKEQILLDNQLKANKKLSVMQALETAVLLMEQAGETEEDIMKYVHLIHLGLIRDGALTPEYIQMAHEARRAKELNEEPSIIIDTPTGRV
jgi:hypothetical protein